MTRRSRVVPALLVILLLAVLGGEPLGAQGVAAVRGIARSADEARREKIHVVLEPVRQAVAHAHSLLDSPPEEGVDEAQLRRLIYRGVQVLKAYDDPVELCIAYQEYLVAFTVLENADRLGFADQRKLLEIESSIPAVHNIPDVVFVARLVLPRISDPPVWSVGLSTNLLGAAAGSAFDLVGSTALKEYFSDNLAVEAVIPLKGATRVAPAIGLAVGEVHVGGVRVWPALMLQQLDTADTRTPSGLEVLSPDQRHWTQVGFGLAVIPPWWIQRVEAGKLAPPLVSVEVKLPFYYPGDPFSALAALFPTKNGDYEKVGGVSFEFSLSIPLHRIELGDKSQLPPVGG